MEQALHPREGVVARDDEVDQVVAVADVQGEEALRRSLLSGERREG